MNMNLTEKFLEKLKNKVYRSAYVAENVRMGIAFQIRAMREQRSMSQAGLGDRLGKPQSVVSRLENPNYGKLTIQSLLEIASAFDVALLVQFVTYPEFIRRTRNVSPQAFQVDEFDVDHFSALRVCADTNHQSISTKLSPAFVSYEDTSKLFGFRNSQPDTPVDYLDVSVGNTDAYSYSERVMQ